MIDWNAFILEMIASAFGSLVGFILAIIGERWLDGIKDKEDAKEIKKLLVEELKACKSDLQNYDVQCLDVQPLKISLWEGISHSNQLSLLDVKTRRDLFSIYNTLAEINSWSYIHTKYYFEKGERNMLLINEITLLRDNLMRSENPNNCSSIDLTIKHLS